jgi:hypothetical protein
MAATATALLMMPASGATMASVRKARCVLASPMNASVYKPATSHAFTGRSMIVYFHWVSSAAVICITSDSI